MGTMANGTHTRGRPARGHAPAKAAELTERRRHVSEARLRGETWSTIAARLDVSRSTAHRAWIDYLGELDPVADRHARRADIREQLEHRLELAAGDATEARSTGDHRAVDRAETRALRILASLCTLDGLNQPAAVDVNVQDTTPRMSEATAAMLAKATQIANERAIIRRPAEGTAAV